MKQLNVKIKFLHSVLGTQTTNEQIYREFIQSKASDAKDVSDEINAIGTEGVVEKGKTIFPRTQDGLPFIYDYQIRGFLKNAFGALSKVKDNPCYQMKAYKKKVDLYVFVKDRRNVIDNYSYIGECQRPLRASTMQGERISLAISEEIERGATCEFKIKCLVDSDLECVKAALDYGQYNGLLQWRNSGKGSFVWIDTDKETDDDLEDKYLNA